MFGPLDPVQVAAWREEYAQRRGSVVAFAQERGVPHQTMLRILYGKTYRRAGGPTWESLAAPKKKSAAPPRKEPLRKWSRDVVEEAYRRFWTDDGTSRCALARVLGMHSRQLYAIAMGDQYRDVTQAVKLWD